MPRATLERLGVPVERTPPSETADGRIITVDVGQTIIRLQGLEFHTQVIFAEPGEPSLLGTVTLEEAALTLDPVAERLIGPSALPTTPCFTPSALSTLTPRHGVPTNPTAAQAWTHTYRQMRHGSATKRLSQYLFSLTQDARLLANGFFNLKTARETADYDPNRVMTVGDANSWIGQARAALIALQAMTVADRQTFSNITLTGNP